MPKLTEPRPSRDPHELIDQFRREGYDVQVRSMRMDGLGHISVELVGYQVSPPHREPAGAKPPEDDFGLGQRWEDVEEWLNC